MPDFSSILSKKPSETVKPLPKPAGPYLAQVVGMPKQDTRTVKGEERGILSFSCKVLQPLDGVDTSQIGAEGIGEVSSWPPMRHDLWDIETPEGEFRFKQFLTDVLKIDPGPPGDEKSYGEMLTEATGKQLIITLVHNPYVDKATGQGEIATNIGSVAAA